jgi:hypothetical protein
LMMADTNFMSVVPSAKIDGRTGVAPARDADQNVLLTWTTNVPLPSSLHEPLDWQAE